MDTPEKFTEDFTSDYVHRLLDRFIKDPVFLAFMDITVLSGTIGFSRASRWRMELPTRGNILALSPNSKAKFQFDFSVRSVRFGCAAGDSSCEINYFDFDGRLLHTARPPKNNEPDRWVDYARDTADIRSVVITDGGTLTEVDHFIVQT
ncbi:hypothetical protein PPN31114_00943 [Pandoraea pneumonica]|jgi:hypothetical protein|uniref:Uncharacterized protein n=1 Tax=Pandoraea pneumonica TaxID=2508299 RepID=A0A5E4SQU9_9BURK|nr:hypothetical protein [Pandoraea pneumonica]VVD77352.1 hypothetical protein PPN31114_00943 [Pandoraea pneumonica]